MPEKWYVCPVHRQIILFRKSRFELLVKIETIPAFCQKCSKYYLKTECVEVEQGEEYR